MSFKKAAEAEGIIASVLPRVMLCVALANKHLVLAISPEKMRKRFVRLMTGDRLKLDMSPYHIDKPRIIYPLA